jgi:hypothetical protein
LLLWDTTVTQVNWLRCSDGSGSMYMAEYCDSDSYIGNGSLAAGAIVGIVFGVLFGCFFLCVIMVMIINVC